MSKTWSSEMKKSHGIIRLLILEDYKNYWSNGIQRKTRQV